MQRYLCNAIEPVTKDMICQRADKHRGPHRAVAPQDGGIVTAEWYDRSALRSIVEKHRAEFDGELERRMAEITGGRS